MAGWGGGGGVGGVTGLMRLPKKFYPEFLIVCESDIQPYLSTPSPSLPPQLALLRKPNKNEIIAHSVPLFVKMSSHQEKKKLKKRNELF